MGFICILRVVKIFTAKAYAKKLVKQEHIVWREYMAREVRVWLGWQTRGCLPEMRVATETRAEIGPLLLRSSGSQQDGWHSRYSVNICSINNLDTEAWCFVSNGHPINIKS
jgi:hypothetical protein